ncbi:MAG: GAF domain-containing sensor histidine kinase, partial [Candidatus Binatia bacterium]
MARKTVPVGERNIQTLPGTFTSSLDPKVILTNLAERTSHILNATRCSVVRVDPVRHPGKAFVFSAIDDPSIEGYSLKLKDYPEIEVALEQNIPILVRDDPNDEVAKRIRKLHRKLPFPVSLAIPLSYRAESFGVLFLRFSDPAHEISREAIMFCQLIAFGAAVALQNAREYETLLAQVKQREHEAQQLADANRLRMETLSAASHDIRVPLNSLVGYTDLLLEQAYGPLAPQQREVLGYMSDNAQNLLQIVNTLIDYARLEEGTVPIDVFEGEVSTLLDELRNIVEPLTQSRPFDVDFQIVGALPLVETDWVKLKRILLNLLHNAIKFTPA